MNNTAGTNGGAVMVSGNINIQDSIIANNNGGETGGSFYIQQPMYDAKTKINVNNNLITNNSSPYGKEIFINWKDSYNLYTDFNNNDWGDEDPNDSSVIDPDNITSRSKVSTTKKSNLFSRLNLDLLDKYSDLLGDFFTNDTLENLKNQFIKDDNNNTQNQKHENNNKNKRKSSKNPIDKGSESNSTEENTNRNSNAQAIEMEKSNAQNILGNSTSHGEDKKAYELNETGRSVAKQANLNIAYAIAGMAIVFLLLAIGYKRNKRFE